MCSNNSNNVIVMIIISNGNCVKIKCNGSNESNIISNNVCVMIVMCVCVCVMNNNMWKAPI
jgi:hypothetical protein